MIIRNKRKRSSFYSRISRSLSRIKPPAGQHEIQTPEQFQLEIDKEVQRSNRRKVNPEFALVGIDFSDRQVSDKQLNWLATEFMGRLRVSDTIGWHQLKLAVLLPETDAEGAQLVCDSLVEIANQVDIELETSISVFPWDDKLFGDSEQHYGNDDVDHQRYDAPEDNLREPKFKDAQRNMTNFLSDVNFGSASQTCVLEAAPAAPPKPRTERKRGTGHRLAFATPGKTPVWKRSIDIVGAGIGLTLLSPVFLVVAVVIKTTSSGPVFFKQRREGKDGDVFEILKFRTMCNDAEAQKADLRKLSEQDGPAFKLTNDPRITTIGKYLRKSCIDELPQLFNVLTGQMSLVGPRPLPVDESMGCLPWQRRRLIVLPGLTCTWQAHGGRDIKFADWMRMDLDYIEQRGLWSDLRLIGETAFVAVLHKGSV